MLFFSGGSHYITGPGISNNRKDIGTFPNFRVLEIRDKLLEF